MDTEIRRGGWSGYAVGTRMVSHIWGGVKCETWPW
jgi:hypothetical protein